MSASVSVVESTTTVHPWGGADHAPVPKSSGPWFGSGARAAARKQRSMMKVTVRHEARWLACAGSDMSNVPQMLWALGKMAVIVLQSQLGFTSTVVQVLLLRRSECRDVSRM